ncbi:MAG TPA: type II toxin-antitoxin system VapC family toxin [Rhizomicrobium sp.]|nr:type II toxin-antitoxin system VapC family toxin [Rhizomicrobium sp.]
MSRIIVIDASIAVQLVLTEPATDAVDAAVLRNADVDSLIAPSILVSETAAAITKKCRRKEITPVSAREAFQVWQEMLADGLFELVPANDLIDEAFALSLRLHHSLHDCLYIALAQSRAAAIATRDIALAGKTKALGLETELIGA